MSTLLQNSLVEGILSGLIASTIFIFLLFFLKPKLHICDKISCQYVNIRGKDERFYAIKIINKSLFYGLYDVRIKAFICQSLSNTNGNNIHRKNIEILGPEQWYIKPLCYKHILQDFFQDDKELQSSTDYAAQFTTQLNLKSLLDQNRYIEIQVLAKHSLTGFSMVKRMHYRHPSKIVDGLFYSGNSGKIAPERPEFKTFIT